MDHSEAIRTHATERYLLNELEDGERLAFEEHYFDCGECAEDVRAAAAFVETVPAALTPRPSTQLHSLAATPARTGGSRTGRLAGLFFPLPLGAAAALVLAVGGVVYQGMESRAALRAARASQPAAWAFLSVSRAEPPQIEVGRADRWLGLTLSGSASPSPSGYRCRLERKGQTGVLEEWHVPAPAAGAELQVLVALQGLTPGPYVLRVVGDRAAGEAASGDARYEFRLRYRGE